MSSLCLSYANFNKEAGAEMSHKRAKDVLPDELIAIIQGYVDGEYV